MCKEMAKIITVKEAAELVQDGAVIGSAVQGMTGWPRDFGRMSEDGKTCRGECALATTDCFHAAYTAMWDVPLR